MANENYTDTIVNNLVINKMSQAQYDELNPKSDTELYLVPEEVDQTPTNGSSNLVSSGGVYAALKENSCYPIDNTKLSEEGGTEQDPIEINSETYYKLGTVNQIYVALNAPTDNSKAHEWVMEFEAGVSNIPFVIDNVNSNAVRYANGEPKFNAGSIYQVSIQEGLAIVVEFVPNQS